jgi:four helix bundle protein
MSTINRFEDIEAWQTARQLTKIVYGLTSGGSFARDLGLRDQMRRAAVSIMSNIAEGFESRTSALFLEYLGRAKGSAGELRAQFYVAQDAGYLKPDQSQGLQDQCEKCSRQISRFMAYLRTSAQNHSGAGASRRSTIPGVKRSNVSTFKRSNDE